MKRLLAWMAASLLTLVAATTAAQAGCIVGFRAPPPGVGDDLCENLPGSQTTNDVDGDGFGDECDWDDDQNCVAGVPETLVFVPLYEDMDYRQAFDFNGNTVLDNTDFNQLRMHGSNLSIYPDYPN